MRLPKVLTLMMIVLGSVMFVSSANAQSVAIVTQNNNCLIPGPDRFVKVMKCTDGGIRYTISNGFICTADDYCFDHQIPLNAGSGDRRVRLVKRDPKNQSQVWWVNKTNGLIENAKNWRVCLNIEGGNDNPETKVIVWPCGFNNPGNNEKFLIGARITYDQFTKLDTGVRTALGGKRTVSFNNGTRLMFAGGDVIMAAGPSGMVAAGGGNVVPTAGGSMVAAGSLNLIGNDGSTIANGLIGLDGGTLRGVGFRTN